MYAMYDGLKIDAHFHMHTHPHICVHGYVHLVWHGLTLGANLHVKICGVPCTKKAKMKGQGRKLSPKTSFRRGRLNKMEGGDPMGGKRFIPNHTWRGTPKFFSNNIFLVFLGTRKMVQKKNCGDLFKKYIPTKLSSNRPKTRPGPYFWDGGHVKR